MSKRIGVASNSYLLKFVLLFIVAIAFTSEYSFGKNIKLAKDSYTFATFKNKDGDHGIAVE